MIEQATLHSMARLTNVILGEGAACRKEQATHRRLCLLWSRSADGSCPICRGTGIYDGARPLMVFDEHKSHMGEVSEEQVRERLEWGRYYCTPVPCFNPACSAQKPEGICQACGGFGQAVIDGLLTDAVCRECSGFGMADRLPAKEVVR